MSIFLFLLMAQAAGQISSEQIGDGRFRLALSNSGIGAAAAQAALAPTARRLCGARPLSFGGFRFSEPDAGAEAQPANTAGTSRFEQEIFCGAGKATVALAAGAPTDWRPSEADQRAVLGATYSYFAAKDGGHYQAAWSILSDQMKSMSTAADWRREAEAFNSRAGPVRARRVTEITWYANPPDAPQPGIYVAADYSAGFEDLDFVCGYVMWRLKPDGSFALTREEQNVFDKARAKSLASIDRAPLRSQMGCKD